MDTGLRMGEEFCLKGVWYKVTFMDLERFMAEPLGRPRE
jgi:hypothetical protein